MAAWLGDPDGSAPYRATLEKITSAQPIDKEVGELISGLVSIAGYLLHLEAAATDEHPETVLQEFARTHNQRDRP